MLANIKKTLPTKSSLILKNAVLKFKKLTPNEVNSTFGFEYLLQALSFVSVASMGSVGFFVAYSKTSHDKKNVRCVSNLFMTTH